MNQSEPNPLRRVVKARILGPDGVTGLPVATVLVFGDLKIVRVDNTIISAPHPPVGTVGAAPGSFDIQLDQVNTDDVGSVRLQLTKPGVVSFWERIVEIIPGDTMLATILEGPNQYDGNGEASLAAGADITVAGALREILAYCANNATGLDGSNAILKSRVGGRNRIVAQLNNGNRTITSRDDS